MATGATTGSSTPAAPPAATRAKVRKETFQYVVEEVLELEPDDPLNLAFKHNSIDSVPKILILTEREIDSMVYSDGTSVDSLPISPKATIPILKDWNYYLIQSQGIRSVNWLDKDIVNTDEFDVFRSGTYDPDNPISTSRTPVFPTSATSSGTSGTSTPGMSSKPVSSQANEFRRGIKRDKSHYSTLKDEKQWDEWKRTTVATVYAHGCENVLSTSYVPSTPEEVLLFKEQNNFMYDVFVSIIKTNMGKYYVRNQDSTRDAQAVWRHYVTYMRTSTRADIQIEDLMTSWTSLRLEPSSRRTTQSFIVSWLDQLRQYEELTPTSARFPDIMKKAMLQNALNNVSAFPSVKNTEQLEVAQGRGSLGYNEYVSLVQKVAANVDRESIGKPRQSPTMRTPPNPRQVNVHEYSMEADPYLPDMYDNSQLVTPEHHSDFDEDAGHEEPDSFEPMSIYAANPTSGFRRRPSLKKETWQSLSKEDQLAWDQISDKGKYAIMFSHKNPTPSPRLSMKGGQAVNQHNLIDQPDDDDELFVDVNQSSPDIDTLISDRAMVEISRKVINVLRHYCINDWQSEPHFQHQNPAERRYQTVKHNTLLVLNTSGAPPNTWLLAMQYVCFLMNRMTLQSLNWRTPFESLLGSTPDISMIYRFKVWDLVYYKRDESREEFPSVSNEASGRFVGFSETVGHLMTYKVLTCDTQRVIFRSRIRRADVLQNRHANGDNERNDDERDGDDVGNPGDHVQDRTMMVVRTAHMQMIEDHLNLLLCQATHLHSMSTHLCCNTTHLHHMSMHLYSNLMAAM